MSLMVTLQWWFFVFKMNWCRTRTEKYWWQMVVSWVFCVIGQGSHRVYLKLWQLTVRGVGFISNGFHFWRDLTTMWNVRTSGGKWWDENLVNLWNLALCSGVWRGFVFAYFSTGTVMRERWRITGRRVMLLIHIVDAETTRRFPVVSSLLPWGIPTRNRPPSTVSRHHFKITFLTRRWWVRPFFVI